MHNGTRLAYSDPHFLRQLKEFSNKIFSNCFCCCEGFEKFFPKSDENPDLNKPAEGEENLN